MYLKWPLQCRNLPCQALSMLGIWLSACPDATAAAAQVSGSSWGWVKRRGRQRDSHADGQACCVLPCHVPVLWALRALSPPFSEEARGTHFSCVPTSQMQLENIPWTDERKQTCCSERLRSGLKGERSGRKVNFQQLLKMSHWEGLVKGAGELAQQLGAPAAFSEDPGSGPNTHKANYLSNSMGSGALFWCLWISGIWTVHMHTGRQNILLHKINRSFWKCEPYTKAKCLLHTVTELPGPPFRVMVLSFRIPYKLENYTTHTVLLWTKGTHFYDNP